MTENGFVDVGLGQLVIDDDLRIDIGRKRIETRTGVVRISQPLWELFLLFLERSPDGVVSSEDFNRIFGSQSEDARFKQVERLRTAIGDKHRSEPLIKTIKGHGYVFTKKPSHIPMSNTDLEDSGYQAPTSQRVRWGPVDGRDPGICIGSCRDGPFIPWNQLKLEVEKMLLPQVRRVPIGSSVAIRDLGDRVNWVVRVIDPSGREIGDVWFGTDADAGWRFDGLVRLGESHRHSREERVVWEAFERYSDGAFRRIAQF